MKKQLTEMSNEELWQLFPIIITKHKDSWKGDYEAEKNYLIEKIGMNNIKRINHIGSTAVKNLVAKPTIDILIEIKKDIHKDNLIRIMEGSGYIYSYQPNNPPPHMMFMKGYTINGFEGQAYHVHIRYYGDWDELYFRDYLIKYPEVAEEYGKLKLVLKEKYKHNRDAYTQAKTEFISKITQLARKEFQHVYKG